MGTWLTLDEAVVWTGRSLTDVVDAMLAGDLRYLTIGEDPRQWFIDWQDFDRWVTRTSHPAE